MRVFKPTYTIPLPESAKILKRKSGPVAKFRNARGEETVAPLSKTGRRVRMETNCYHIEFVDHNGYSRRLKASTNEGASRRYAVTIQDVLDAKGTCQSIGQDLRRRIEALPVSMRAGLGEWGLLDENQNMAAKPLTFLLERYQQHLEVKELCGQYVRRTVRDLKHVFDACGFTYLSHVSADKILDHLKDRRAERTIEDPHTPNQKRVKRGISFRRSNSLLMSAKCFLNWCEQREFIPRSPLRGQKAQLLDADKDRRRIRRALEIDQLRRLFEVTETSADVVLDLTGPERGLLYRLAAESGIRRGELMQLTVADFDLVGLTITVRGNVSKNGKERIVPLSPAMATRLRQHFAAKLPTAQAMQVPNRTAEMIRIDLERAGIPYEDDRGHVFDFHCLRGECATLMLESGADPKVVQQILGHSDIRLTLQIYAKVLDEKAKRQQAAAALSNLLERAG